MDRLSALDAEFLHIEEDDTPMHIAGLCMMTGPPPSLAELRRALACRLDDVPRYRQRVESVPLDLGRPVWVDHAEFRVTDHVRRRRVPAPGDDAALDRIVTAMLESRLDRSRPLWEVWLLDGLAGGGWALFAKVHHCMVDGVAGMQLLELLFDITPDGNSGTPTNAGRNGWTPEPAPNGARRVLGAWRGLGEDATSWLSGVRDAVRNPAVVARTARDRAVGAARLLPILRPTPHTSIEGPVGRERIWAHRSVSMADIADIRKRFGGTINDVLLSAVTAGYRDLLVAHGDDAEAAVVRTVVPVSVRDGEVAGNRVSMMVLDLPVGAEDPLDRLATVHDQMEQLKASHEIEAAATLAHLSDLLPPFVVAGASRWALRLEHLVTQRSVTTVVTNVPGPQFPLYALGHEMTGFVPYVGLSQGIRLTTALASFNGHVAIAVTADAATIPDAAIVVDSAAREIDTLREAALVG